MPRREFPKAVKAEMIRRATMKGEVHCEGCGVATTRFDCDHTIPDALYLDKSRPLTAADGKVLCAGSPDSCHGQKTPQDVKVIAKAKRNEATHLRITGRPTALSGPTPAEKREIKAARSALADKLPMPQPRSLFR